MAHVERTKWMTSAWDCTLGHGCVYWASQLTKWTALGSMSSLWSSSGQFLNSCCHLPPRPLTPSVRWPKIGAHLQKNDLKWPKIKQVTNSNLYYIKFNISISTILLNKAGLTRAKADYTNYNFYFHNHPQVRTRPVFPWTVTNNLFTFCFSYDPAA